MQGHGDLPFQVIGLSNVLRSWSRYPTASSTLAKTWMHADPLLHCRDVALQKPLTTEPTLASWGALFNELDILNTRIGNIEHVTRKRASVRNKNEIDEVLHKVAKVKRTPREVHREMDRRLNQQRDSILKQLKATGAPLEKGLVSSTSSLLVRSPLARVRVGPSASSKVNFILNEVSSSTIYIGSRVKPLQVLQHAVRDKFLIFSASPLSLAHLKEALDLAGVPALEFTGRVSARAREQFVTTFETSDTFRVFLMELKHGARGLLVADVLV
jgi:SNF2 family DNA or RNA helicase